MGDELTTSGVSNLARRNRKSRVLGWHVAETWEHGEHEARRGLRAAGFECEYPMMRLPRNRIGERRVVPLFPSYVFVRESDAWKSIRSVRGVARLLMNDGCPSLVSDVDVQFFMTGSVDSFGYYVDPSCRMFKPGDVVRPRSGRFAGIGGEFARMMDNARCEVRFWLLGQPVVLTHAVCDLT